MAHHPDAGEIPLGCVRGYSVAMGMRFRLGGLGAGAALALAVAGCGDSGKDKSKMRPPQLVTVTAAASEPFAPRLVALGTVTPLQTVQVRPRADGQITAILFREGDFVRAGQPLFRLDDRQARAALAQAQAQLASAVAAERQARADLDRALALVGKGFISGAIVDQRKAAQGSALANIENARAQIQAAQTQLSFMTVAAPVSGRTGELGFRLGANVRQADAAPLVTVNQLSPIQVRFLVPPDHIQTVRGALQAGTLRVTARAEGNDQAPPLATGRLVFLDNNVDPGNGGVAAKAEFANADDRLWPGAILSVELPLGQARPSIALPEGAVQTGRDAPFVWTVGADGKVMMRDVDVAGRAAGKVYLAGGVTPGEKVVTDALARLKEGDKIRAKGPGRPPVTAAVEPRAASAAPAAVPAGPVG